MKKLWFCLAALFCVTNVMAGIAFETLNAPFSLNTPLTQGVVKKPIFDTSLCVVGNDLYLYESSVGALYRSSNNGSTWTSLTYAWGETGSLQNAKNGKVNGNCLAYWQNGGKLIVPRIEKTDEGGTNSWDNHRTGMYDIATNTWSWLNTGPGNSGTVLIDSGLFISGNYAYGNQHAGGSHTTIRLNLAGTPGVRDQAISGLFGLHHVSPAGYNGIYWYSRTVMHTMIGTRVYSIKTDEYAPLSEGDELWSWDLSQYVPGGSMQVNRLSKLPWAVGAGDSIVGLPANWMGCVGEQGGLFIVRGRGGDYTYIGNSKEGWGNGTTSYAIYDISSGQFTSGNLPGLNGRGSSAVFHNGTVYIKRGLANPSGDDGLNGDLWKVVPEPGTISVIGFGIIALGLKLIRKKK